MTADAKRTQVRPNTGYLTEKEWLALVVELARTLGWLCFHPFLSIRSERGWPDLSLVRERLVFIELKSDKGRTTPAQEKWINALKEAGAEAYVFRPADWDDVVAVLTRRDA